jgi:hypothetical protein
MSASDIVEEPEISCQCLSAEEPPVNPQNRNRNATIALDFGSAQKVLHFKNLGSSGGLLGTSWMAAPAFLETTTL